jgi:hypothetical protein
MGQNQTHATQQIKSLSDRRVGAEEQSLRHGTILPDAFATHCGASFAIKSAPNNGGRSLSRQLPQPVHTTGA